MRVRDAEIAVEHAGEGMALVWGHGLTQSRRLEDRRPLVDLSLLAARVVRYDARGHGESESTPELAGYGWEELARDQLELATALGIDRYVAAGASMGAATALHAAVIAPERIDALVLVIPPTGWETRAEQTGAYEQGAALIETVGVERVIAAGSLVAPPDPFVDDPDFHVRRAEGLAIHRASVIVRTRMSVFPSWVLKRTQKPLKRVRNQKPGQILLRYSA